MYWTYEKYDAETGNVIRCPSNDNDGTPIVNNPDSGRYHVPVSSFKTLYSGVAYFNGEPQDA